jgi:predicted ATP-grasp superfamily ATP-dependent carboligase
LSKYKDIFSNYTQIPPPHFEVFYKAFDKKKLLELAIGKKIACPITYFSNEITEIIDEINHYPVVVKPTKRHGIKIAICNSQNDLLMKYETMAKNYGTCIVQEYIPNGGEFGVYTIFNKKSIPIALTVQKRLRCKYNYGGISTLRKTTNNNKIVEIAFDLLKHIKWSGAAMVEFRIDPRDNTPKLMEINPRFWGSLNLSILAGINFPYILYQLTMREDILPNLNFKEDVLCRWLILETLNFLKEPDKLKRLPDLLRIDIANDIISIRDPKPGLIALFQPTLDSSDEEHRYDCINDEIWNNSIINK